jgi:hypothetical protein
MGMGMVDEVPGFSFVFWGFFRWLRVTVMMWW